MPTIRAQLLECGVANNGDIVSKDSVTEARVICCFDKGKTANKQVSWNEVEVRFEGSVALHAAVELWGLFRRLQKVTKHSSSSLTKPHRLNWRATRQNGQERGLPFPKSDYSD